jgi:hypothetical protein
LLSYQLSCEGIVKVSDSAQRQGVHFKHAKSGTNEYHSLGPLIHLGDYHYMHHADDYYRAAAEKELQPPSQDEQTQPAAGAEHQDVLAALPFRNSSALSYIGMMTEVLSRDKEHNTSTGCFLEPNTMAAAL